MNLDAQFQVSFRPHAKISELVHVVLFEGS